MSIYQASVPGSALRQGELLSNVVLVRIVPGADPHGTSVPVRAKSYDLAFVLSQDCDLQTDFLNRGKPKPKKLCEDVLLCEAQLLSEVTTTFTQQGTTAWERLRKNSDFRYHYLQNIEPSEDLDSVGIDYLIVSFQRIFCVPMDDLLERINKGETHRRTIMDSPYFEHLSDRFCHYHGRVGLPKDHHIP